MSIYHKLIDRILDHEGGYVNHPNDPGGETKFGIAKRSYPHVNIAALTRVEAIEIYRRDFYEPVAKVIDNEDLLFQVLDAAVNHGMGNATRMLQRALDVADDGHWGPISRRAYQDYIHFRGPDKALAVASLGMKFLAQRLRFWSRLSTFKDFGAGWVRRGAGNLDHLAEDVLS